MHVHIRYMYILSCFATIFNLLDVCYRGNLFVWESGSQSRVKTVGL